MERNQNQSNSHAVHFEVNAKDERNTEYRFSIDFFVFVEDGIYISYCPALDISASGSNFNEAVSNFYECFQLHIECCVENNTLIQDLELHGWKVNKVSIIPPKFTFLMRTPTMKHLIDNNIGFERISTPVRMPMFT